MDIKFRPLGKTGLLVSEIGFGALEIGRDWAADVNKNPSHLTEQEASNVLNGLLDLGVNFIDTAPAYWYSEEYIGKAISHRRKEFVLATKVGEHCDEKGSIYDYSGSATKHFIDTSLQRLRTDYIDLIQIHSASIEVLERGETLSAMSEARQAGKVLHIGMTEGVKECIRGLEIGGYETVQFPYNLLNIEAEEKLLPLIREKRAGSIIMRGLAGGKLSEKYKYLQNEKLRNAIEGFLQFVGTENDKTENLASLALGYLFARSEVSSVIVGTRRLEAVKRNIQSVKKCLSPDLLNDVQFYARSLDAKIW